MSYTLIRKVLIRERELKKLKRHALVKSPYGNKNLYDSIEWRPITTKDLAVEILKGVDIKISNAKEVQGYFRHFTNSMYDKRYYYWDYTIIDNIVMIRPELGGKTYFEPFGWAVLKKEFDK